MGKGRGGIGAQRWSNGECKTYSVWKEGRIYQRDMGQNWPWEKEMTIVGKSCYINQSSNVGGLF